MQRPLANKDAMKQTKPTDPQFIGPVGQTHSFAIKGDIAIGAGISSLLLERCPSTISRLIITVVINAIKGMVFSWTPSYVFNECGKRMSPFLTDTNSPTAIIRKKSIFRINGALNHLLPNVVFGHFFNGFLEYTLFSHGVSLLNRFTDLVRASRVFRHPQGLFILP